MKGAYIDVETTGLNAWRNDIIQLAVLIEIDGKIVKELEYKIKPVNIDNVDQEAVNTHGVSVDEMSSFPDPKEVYEDLLKQLGKFVNKFDRSDKFTPIGYNVKFDIDFLQAFFKKNGDKYYGSWFNWMMVDPLQKLYDMRYRGMIDYKDYKLATVCKELQIDIKAHDAMSDIKATRDLLKLLGSS